tara:strand:+ start:2009 stop:2437 length:429 start_codon:yes stop_codon:yes gene_type:complete
MKRNMKVLGVFSVMMICSMASVASYFGSESDDEGWQSDPEEYTYTNSGDVFKGADLLIPRTKASDNLHADIEASEKEERIITTYTAEKLREIGDRVRADPDLNAEIRETLRGLNILRAEEGTQDAPVVENLAPAAGSTESYQ